MPEKFDVQKLKSQYLEFFERVSPKLLKFIFSEETSAEIAKICLENEIEDEEKIEKIAYRITLALLNQVPKENLVEILEKGVKLNHGTAEKIAIEIKRRIFSQISEIEKEKKPTKLPEAKPDVKLRKARKDIYREPIE